MPLDHAHEGVLHLIYTAHGSDADFQRIEADLDQVAAECPHLVLVLEDVLPPELFRQRLDPSLRNLPPDALFDSRTTTRHKEEFARAYASAVGDIERGYRAWNEAPAARRHEIFGEVSGFNRGLLAWAATHRVEILRGETSLEAWLAQTSHTVFQRAAVGAASGDPATMWAEHRRECELLAKAIQLRDADTNAQLTRLLLVERRGHDVLYVVGALHAVNEELLVFGLNALVHQKPIPEAIGDQPAVVRQRLETLAFLQDRLRLLARPTTSVDEVVQIIHKIDHAAVARNVTLRQLVDRMVTNSEFQNAARALDAVALRWLTAVAFTLDMIHSGFIGRSEVEEHLHLARP
jgi:hypothetical protein